MDVKYIVGNNYRYTQAYNNIDNALEEFETTQNKETEPFKIIVEFGAWYRRCNNNGRSA